MTPSTRSKEKSPDGALKHIMVNVLKAKDGTPFHLAFQAAGVGDVLDFIELNKDDLERLSWSTGSPPTLSSLTVVEVNKLLALQCWYLSLPEPSVELWYDLTNEAFQAYWLEASSA